MQPDLYVNHANNLLNQTRLGEAIEKYHLALQRSPHSGQTYYNLGRAYSLQGRRDEAEKFYRLALQLEPDNLIIHQAILQSMNYNPVYKPKTIFLEHIRLGGILV